MKKTLSILTAFIFACLPVVSEINGAEILKKIDASTAYTGVDFTADYVLVQEKADGGKSSTTATMYRRDSKSMFTILITGPESDKGKGYIQYDDSIWMYDPHDRQFSYTTGKNKFNNTNLNNSDLCPQSYSKNYTVQSCTESKLGNLECYCLVLKASVKNVDYPEIKLWVTKDDYLTRKREDYSLSGQLLRTTAIPKYQKLDNRSVPATMLVQDNLRGMKVDGKMKYEKTQITVSNVSFQKQGDVVYSKQFLENMSN